MFFKGISKLFSDLFGSGKPKTDPANKDCFKNKEDRFKKNKFGTSLFTQSRPKVEPKKAAQPIRHEELEKKLGISPIFIKNPHDLRLEEVPIGYSPSLSNPFDIERQKKENIKPGSLVRYHPLLKNISIKSDDWDDWTWGKVEQDINVRYYEVVDPSSWFNNKTNFVSPVTLNDGVYTYFRDILEEKEHFKKCEDFVSSINIKVKEKLANSLMEETPCIYLGSKQLMIHDLWPRRAGGFVFTLWEIYVHLLLYKNNKYILGFGPFPYIDLSDEKETSS